MRPLFLLNLLASVALAQAALPTIDCKDATAGRANVIYVAGSTAIRPFLTVVANLVRADGYTLVYQAQGSCTGVAAKMPTGSLENTKRPSWCK